MSPLHPPIFSLPRSIANPVKIIGLIILAFFEIRTAGAQDPSVGSRFSVEAQGAVGDGKTDNTIPFQKALDACGASGGGIVEVPAGMYRFDGTLNIPANVTLRGTFTSAPTVTPQMLSDGKLGSTLLPHAGKGDPAGDPFISFQGPNGTLEGFAVYYPEWDPKIIPPVPYPPTVATGKAANCENLTVRNMIFVNSYEAIHFDRAARHLIRDVTGYPIRRGIYIDSIGDIGRIENVHFWPFNYDYKIEDPYCHWINTEGVSFEVGFSDWQIFQNCFSFGYGVGYKFTSSAGDPRRSSCGKMVASGADCSEHPIQFDAMYSHWLIGESEFVCRWGGKNTTAVEIGPGAQGRIGFSNCAFWGPISRVVTMRAPQGIVSLEGCQISNWEDGAGAISIEQGRAIISGNSFDREGSRHLIVGDKAGRVIASDNLASPRFDVQAAPGSKVQLSNNQE